MIPISDPGLQRRTTPYVNIGIITICTLVMAYELFVLSSLDRQLFFFRYGLIARELSEGINFTGLRAPGGNLDIESHIPAWGTVFTSMFIHADIMHFAFNMVFLWVFGDNVEDRFGHVGYLAFYLAGGVAAGWAQVAVDSAAEVPMIGASGAIAAVLGAYLLLYPFSQVRTLVIFIFITYIRVPALYLLGFWLLIQFVGGVGSLGPSAQSGGTAYWAHVGGFAAGLAGIAALKLLVWREQLWPRPPRRPDFLPPDDRL